MTVPARRTTVTRTGTMRSLTLTLKSQVVTLSVPLGAAWITLGINAMLGGWLNRFGIIPRSLDGLRGILFAPFLHGNLAHLTANSASFLVLGWLVLATGRRNFARVSVLAALGSGITSWVLGAPNSVHIGASGVIFGYLGYLMLSGVFARKFSTIALSVAVTAAWGAMVWGVLPGQMGVSWQGHLGGFVGGVLAARWIHARAQR